MKNFNRQAPFHLAVFCVILLIVVWRLGPRKPRAARSRKSNAVGTKSILDSFRNTSGRKSFESVHSNVADREQKMAHGHRCHGARQAHGEN